MLVAAMFNGVISPLFRTIGIVLIVILGFVWVVSFLLLSVISPMMVRFGPDSDLLSWIGWIAIVLLVVIPLLSVVLGLSGWTFRYRTYSGLKATLLTIWFVSLFTSATVITKTAESYKHRKETVTVSDYAVPEDEIFVKSTDDFSGKKLFGIMTGNIRISPESMKMGGVNITIKESDDHLLHIERKVLSYGKNEKDAIRNMEFIRDNFTVTGNEISFSRLLEIEPGKKYRGQTVSYTVYVPKGKKVNTDFHDHIGKIKLFDKDFYEDSDSDESEEGLSFENESTDHFILKESIDNIVIAGPVSLIVKKGEKPGYTINAPEAVRSRLKIRQDNSSINLTCREEDGCESVTLVVVTPDIRMLSLYDLTSIEIRGFQSEKLKMISHSASTQTKVFIDSDLKSLDLNVDGPQTVLLKGEGNAADIHLAGGAVLNGKSFKVKNAVIHGTNYGSSELWVTGQVNMTDGVRPEFVFTGNPVVK